MLNDTSCLIYEWTDCEAAATKRLVVTLVDGSSWVVSPAGEISLFQGDQADRLT